MKKPTIQLVCKACGFPHDSGKAFCPYCGRSRGLNQYFQFKLWELVFLLAIMLMIILFCSASAAILPPQSVPTTTFTATITPRPSNTPIATQTRPSAPSSTPSPIRASTKTIIHTNTEVIIGYAKISGEVEEVNVRKSPGYTTKDDLVDVVTKLPSGSTIKLLRGPEKADGLKWWYIEWHGYEGWIAEKTGNGRTILIFEK